MSSSPASPSLIKDLREKTGAGMLDCKKALEASGGNVEEAVDWLRKKGLAAAAKKASRTAAEGLVAVAVRGTVGAAVEVNAETDFVARNEIFQGFVREVADLALDAADMDALKAKTMANGATVEAALTQLIATIGENMVLRRMARVEVPEGAVASYIHNAVIPGLGKIGVLVALKSAAPAEALLPVGKQLAMHAAAAKPDVLKIEQVKTEALDRERAVLTEQAASSGKPPEVIAKMVEGRLRKYYEEVVLLEQVFVVDGESKVKDVVQKTGKELGQSVELADFALLVLGAGIEKEATDFAAEVASLAR